MSYDKADLEKKALAAIKRHKIKFITHVAAFLPCSEKTIFNKELQELQSIKDAIEENRISSKVKTLNKWEKSENATLQVAFMKLIADDDEADRLNGTKQKMDVTSKGNELQREFTINVVRSNKKTNESNDWC